MKKFELTRGTSVKVLKVTPRHEMMGKKDTRPAISLRLCWETTNESLNLLHPNLRDLLSWRPPALVAQDSIETVAQTVPSLRVPNIEQPLKLKDQEYTGYTMIIDFGLGESAGSEIELYECKQDKFEFTVKEGGPTKVVWSVHSNKEITPELVGIVFSLEGRDIGIGLEAPQPAIGEGQAIDGTGKQFNKEHPLLDSNDADPNVPQGDATSTYVQQHGEAAAEGGGGDDDEGSGGADGAAGGGEPAEPRGEGWPFPRHDGPAGDSQRDSGRDGELLDRLPSDADSDAAAAKEQAELEAGMSASVAAAGLRPGGGRRAPARGRAKGGIE